MTSERNPGIIRGAARSAFIGYGEKLKIRAIKSTKDNLEPLSAGLIAARAGRNVSRKNYLAAGTESILAVAIYTEHKRRERKRTQPEKKESTKIFASTIKPIKEEAKNRVRQRVANAKGRVRVLRASFQNKDKKVTR